MIIKGNTVGTTMPKTNYEQTDRTKADYLKGKDLLDEKIQAAQTAADNAQTAAANKVDKSQIVNTYLSEEEGRVPDARALKRLHDKLDDKFNIVRLWQNASPESTFDNQTVKVTASPYNVFIIRFKLCSSYSKYAYGIGVKNNYGWLSAAMGSAGTAGAHTALAWREFAINSSGSIVFYDAHKDGNSLVDAPIEDNDWIVPDGIYGVSGGITL